jgi:hypothetical protein
MIGLFSLDLLRRHVVQRAGNASVDGHRVGRVLRRRPNCVGSIRPGQTEVENLDLVIIDDNVPRLEISVRDPLLVDSSHRIRHRDGDSKELG